MSLEVSLTLEAERDLEDVYRYVARSSSPELDALGITDYREVLHRPYRIFYRVLAGRVIVYAILDGRRDMRSLLERRLLR